jgi:hypothetical protein
VEKKFGNQNRPSPLGRKGTEIKDRSFCDGGQSTERNQQGPSAGKPWTTLAERDAGGSDSGRRNRTPTKLIRERMLVDKKRILPGKVDGGTMVVVESEKATKRWPNDKPNPKSGAD